MVPWFICFNGLWFTKSWFMIFVGPLNLKSWTHRDMMIGISPEVMTDTNQLQSSKWKCGSVCIRLANSPTTAGFQTCEASYADQTRGLGDLWLPLFFAANIHVTGTCWYQCRKPPSAHSLGIPTWSRWGGHCCFPNTECRWTFFLEISKVLWLPHIDFLGGWWLFIGDPCRYM